MGGFLDWLFSYGVDQSGGKDDFYDGPDNSWDF